ncbi:hypothetical protein TTHERM_00133620 (macronuclear) [Tetrahymena thermophila SB210]|uniref:Uncharacterized protein n=1 Tax=Tetrahymena thermophila (strain SB210) TaxID=312017 RepID=I7M8P2_TETTS|nr:hypothetical protein TTHERM_00133620 [Tetrahymena thermophila SB210]EAR99396.1 hypothetical protein TTHERM_00133620 [Tetrahymena thermophila SB210]|eukprot:XP_001019641.1 hypothetical protein TTHERM_00133620 [Tetrahymena thermophila SB210]
MDQVFLNQCPIKGHYASNKDQICLDEECECEIMCLYCRIDHIDNNKNHNIIPINEIAEKIQLLQKPQQIQNNIINQANKILLAIQKQIDMKFIYDLEQTNYFRLYQEIKDLDLTCYQNIIKLNKQTLKQLLVVYKSYEQDIQQELNLDENDKKQIVEMIFQKLNPLKKQNKLFQEFKYNPQQEQIENFIGNLNKQQQSFELQEEIEKLENQIRSKDIQIQEKVEVINSLQQLIQNVSDQNSNYDNEIESYKQTLEEYQKKNKQYLKNIKENNSFIKQLEETNKDLIKTIEKQQQETNDKKSSNNCIKLLNFPLNGKISQKHFDELFSTIQRNFVENLDNEYQKNILQLTSELYSKLEQHYTDLQQPL